jgi:hypothetical protein
MQWIYLFDQRDQVQKIVGTVVRQELSFLSVKSGPILRSVLAVNTAVDAQHLGVIARPLPRM